MINSIQNILSPLNSIAASLQLESCLLKCLRVESPQRKITTKVQVFTFNGEDNSFFPISKFQQGIKKGIHKAYSLRWDLMTS